MHDGNGAKKKKKKKKMKMKMKMKRKPSFSLEHDEATRDGGNDSLRKSLLPIVLLSFPTDSRCKMSTKW